MTPPKFSASGSAFAVDSELFHKTSDVSGASRAKAQAEWTRESERLGLRHIPRLHFSYWSPTFVQQSSARVAGSTLADAMLKGSASDAVFPAVLEYVIRAMHAPSLSAGGGGAQKVVSQTMHRASQFGAQPRRKASGEIEPLAMRSRSGESLEMLLLATQRRVAAGWMDFATEARLHGDLHFGNIVLGHQDWWMIDARGRFPNDSSSFDPYYEWGKVFHELHGLYSLTIATSTVLGKRSRMTDARWVRYRARIGSLRKDAIKLLNRNAKAYGEETLNLRRLALFEGLIFVGIIPFHLDAPSRVNHFLCVGTELIQAAHSATETELELLFEGDAVDLCRGGPLGS